MYGMDYQKAFRTVPHSLIKSFELLDKKKQALNQESHKQLEKQYEYTRRIDANRHRRYRNTRRDISRGLIYQHRCFGFI
jgi:hypothetical protein